MKTIFKYPNYLCSKKKPRKYLIFWANFFFSLFFFPECLSNVGIFILIVLVGDVVEATLKYEEFLLDTFVSWRNRKRKMRSWLNDTFLVSLFSTWWIIQFSYLVNIYWYTIRGKNIHEFQTILNDLLHPMYEPSNSTNYNFIFQYV